MPTVIKNHNNKYIPLLVMANEIYYLSHFEQRFILEFEEEN